MRPAEKDRSGEPNYPRRIAVESEKGADKALLWMTVTDEGPIEEADSATEAMAVSIGSLVQRGESEMTTADIAASVARKPQDSTFRRALAEATERGYAAKVKRGVYGAGDAAIGGLDV
jgi:hypothetical protein